MATPSDAQNALIRVGLAGDIPDLDWAAACYQELPGAGLVFLADGDAARRVACARRHETAVMDLPVLDALRSNPVDILEAAVDPSALGPLLQAAFQCGCKAVLLHPPVPLEAQEWSALEVTTAQHNRVFVFDRLRSHPLVRTVQRLLKDEAIGEPQMLRIRTLRCGGGGDPAWDRRCNNLYAWPWRRSPAAEVGLLAECLFGPLAEVHAVEHAGTLLESWRFAAPGRYGLHEVVDAAGLSISSPVEAVDDVIELTGTDGVLWLRNLRGRLHDAPRLMLKRKDTVTVFDDRTTYDPHNVAQMVRRRTAATLGRRNRELTTLAQTRRAVAIRTATEESLATRAAVRVK